MSGFVPTCSRCDEKKCVRCNIDLQNVLNLNLEGFKFYFLRVFFALHFLAPILGEESTESLTF